METKVCSKCAEVKNLDDYARKGSDRLRSECKSCTNLYNTQYRNRDPNLDSTTVKALSVEKRIKAIHKQIAKHEVSLNYTYRKLDLARRTHTGISLEYSISGLNGRIVEYNNLISMCNDELEILEKELATLEQ